MPYFLYKPLDTQMLGGLIPHNAEGVKFGIAEAYGYFLGHTENEQLIRPFQQYVICFIDDETAEGFQLLNATHILEDIDSARPLTNEELSKQRKAKLLIEKLNLRTQISAQIGDLADLVADLTKRVEFLERLLVRIMYYYLRNEDVPDSIKTQYLPFITEYLNLVDNGKFKTRFDIEQPQQLFDKLITRYTKLTNLVEQYLQKKEQSA